MFVHLVLKLEGQHSQHSQHVLVIFRRNLSRSMIFLDHCLPKQPVAEVEKMSKRVCDPGHISPFDFPSLKPRPVCDSVLDRHRSRSSHGNFAMKVSWMDSENQYRTSSYLPKQPAI